MHTLFDSLAEKTQEEKIDILSSKLDYLEDAMSLALDLATIGIWDWDIRTDTMTWDTNMLKLFKIESFGGNYPDFLLLLDPDCAKGVGVALNTCIVNHQIYDYAYKLKNRNIFIRGRGKCLYDSETKQPIRFIGVCIESIPL